MPHIILNCYKGRTPEQKKMIAEKLKQAAVEVMGCDPSRVSVNIRDHKKENWKQVFEKELIEDAEHTVISPGYTYESLD